MFLFFFFFFKEIFTFIYLFSCTRSQLQHLGCLVTACWGLLAVAHRIQFREEGLNPGPLHWELGVLATGPPGTSPCSSSYKTAILSD